MILGVAHCVFGHASWWAQFLHPGQLRTPCGGYWFWSGLGSDISEVTLIGMAVALLRHRNCHAKGCWRLGHIDPEHGHPACRRHHSQADKLGDR